jgi:hypothetical protein
VAGQGLFHFARQAQVRQGIAQQSADQEFQAQVVNPLAAFVIGLAGGFHPAIDDHVAQRQAGGGIPVMRLGRAFVLAHPVAQHIDDVGVDLGNLGRDF